MPDTERRNCSNDYPKPDGITQGDYPEMNREQHQQQQQPKVNLETSKEFEKNGQDALKAFARLIMVNLAWNKAGLFDPK